MTASDYARMTIRWASKRYTIALLCMPLVFPVGFAFVAQSFFTKNCLSPTRIHARRPVPSIPMMRRRNISSMSATKDDGSGGGALDGFFDNIGRFFGKRGNERCASTDFPAEDSLCIFTIPAKSVKVGGLRLFLTLHLMGQQNTPSKGTWKCNQSNDGDLDMYYADATAALTVELDEDGISVYRQGGTTISMEYMTQEGLILQGLLDELNDIVQAEDVDVADRLLVLEDPGDAIEKARDALSFA